MSRSDQLVRYYSDLFSLTFSGRPEGAAKAYFSGWFEAHGTGFHFPLPRWIGGGFLLACICLSAFTLRDYDFVKIREQVDSHLGEGFVAVWIDDQSRPLFNPQSYKAYELCPKNMRQCFVTLQDIRTRPQIMADPVNGFNQACRFLAGKALVNGVQLNYEPIVKKTGSASNPEQTQCRLVNRSQVKAMDYLYFKWLLLAMLLNFIGLAGYLMSRRSKFTGV